MQINFHIHWKQQDNRCRAGHVFNMSKHKHLHNLAIDLETLSLVPTAKQWNTKHHNAKIQHRLLYFWALTPICIVDIKNINKAKHISFWLIINMVTSIHIYKVASFPHVYSGDAWMAVAKTIMFYFRWLLISMTFQVMWI